MLKKPSSLNSSTVSSPFDPSNRMRVGVEPRLDEVRSVARVPDERVVARLAVEGVVAATAVDEIVAVVAVEHLDFDPPRSVSLPSFPLMSVRGMTPLDSLTLRLSLPVKPRMSIAGCVCAQSPGQRGRGSRPR